MLFPQDFWGRMGIAVGGKCILEELPLPPIKNGVMIDILTTKNFGYLCIVQLQNTGD